MLLLYVEEGYYGNGEVGYDRETNTIYFYGEGEMNKPKYSIECSQIDTPEKQILFLDFIKGMSFVTKKGIEGFFECLAVAGIMPKGKFYKEQK